MAASSATGSVFTGREEKGVSQRERGRERALRRSYPLVQRVGNGGHLLAGIDGGQPSTELLAAREEDDDQREMGWA
jgi:hypothetical protein